MKLDSLVNSIQAAAIAANEALHDRNKNLINLYFDKTDELTEREVKNKISKNNNLAPEDVEKIMSSLASSFLDKIKGNSEKLIPKMVTVQFPRETNKGPVVHDVHVPLITLVPLSLTEVSNIKFKTDIEIKIIDDELNLSFPAKDNKETSDKTLTNIEINIDKSLPPEGLRKLIEGYERALRAQIPG
ncbi:uncharacterized protein DUF2589 [Kordia periserrulae]|uniref:Uncharacterized protein DUF2589 n=1 Tax=Kordia periserrulae TaxID=701523 RepID=A0A2T6BTS8_9FLAO|nr:DUF2589 domain-containing protein [Kordia periserrulae]PTX59464.1 uncharacterized protein DUF2589 [Kordia periserrulae]